jgi:serine/threonine-protein kinase
LLRRCLEKDRKRRLDSAADARLEIDEALTGPIGESSTVSVTTPRPAWLRALPWAVAVGALVVASAVLALWAPWRRPAPVVPTRLTAEIGAEASLTNGQGQGANAILSPDGRVLAFVGRSGSDTRLYVRRLEQLQAAPLAGTDGAVNPFFSPDGSRIAFFANGKLKKIAVAGGPAVTICDAPNNRGGWWAEDGTIVFSPERSGAGLLRVSSAGGAPAPLTKLDEREVTHRWPQVLPGGSAVLYTAHSSAVGFDDANIVVQPLPSGPRKILRTGGYYARYLASGHLVFLHDATVFAVPFDLRTLSISGEPAPAIEGVTANAASGGAQFAVSETGTLVFTPGQGIGGSTPIAWLNRNGTSTPLRATSAPFANPQFSPDGQRLAMDITDGKQSDVFMFEWAQDRLTQLTFDPADDIKPVWTPDGRRLVFASSRADKRPGTIRALSLYWQRADGTGGVQRLTTSTLRHLPASWHPSGRFLAYTADSANTGKPDIMILPMQGDEASGWTPGTPTTFLGAPFGGTEPAFSPDGKWIAYQSNESGPFEVYVRPFPGPGGQFKISTTAAALPTWSRTRNELMFATPDGLLFAPYTTPGDSFRAEKPRAWVTGSPFVQGVGRGSLTLPTGNRFFAMHPDGERLAIAAAALAPVAQTAGGAKQDHVTFIFNFFDELLRIAPVTKR